MRPRKCPIEFKFIIKASKNIFSSLVDCWLAFYMYALHHHLWLQIAFTRSISSGHIFCCTATELILESGILLAHIVSFNLLWLYRNLHLPIPHFNNTKARVLVLESSYTPCIAMFCIDSTFHCPSQVLIIIFCGFGSADIRDIWHRSTIVVAIS